MCTLGCVYWVLHTGKQYFEGMGFKTVSKYREEILFFQKERNKWQVLRISPRYLCIVPQVSFGLEVHSTIQEEHNCCPKSNYLETLHGHLKIANP